jgi:hypothetical protein
MPEITLKDLEQERERLHRKNLDVRISSNRLLLRVKDSRLPGENEALKARHVTVGAWEFYTLDESRQVFA